LVPLAIAYDFDGTLAPGNMQERDFIPDIRVKPKEFWEEAARLAKEQNADHILMYMQHMLKKAKEKGVSVTKDNFVNYGKGLRFFDGIDDYSDKKNERHYGWFKRIKLYGKQSGVEVTHYIISSGLREMIEGTKIAKFFSEIYASGFFYDENNVASWPALALNYTTKTQYLFRINKGCLNVFDNSIINDYIPQEKRHIPFKNIIFIGDGETDVPCFRLVKEQGGHSIAVYQPNKKFAIDKPKRLYGEGRVNFIAHADYREECDIDKIVKAIIDKLSADNHLYSLLPKQQQK
jgi:hypothetical protein